MTFTSPDEVIGFLDALILRPPDVFHLLPPRLRQIARQPYMSALLDELGHPEDALRVAHVTGTSGKGSTATLIVPKPIGFASNAKLCFFCRFANLCYCSLPHPSSSLSFSREKLTIFDSIH